MDAKVEGKGDIHESRETGDDIPTEELPWAVIKVGVPRRPCAVEGERKLLVVLVLLTPHPKGGKHLHSKRSTRAHQQMKTIQTKFKIYCEQTDGETWPDTKPS